MSDHPLRVEHRPDGVVLLTLDLPERRNAMTGELTAAWTDAIAKLRADRSVRAVVVTGEGKAFCAGGDLSWIGESPDLSVSDIRDRMLPFYRAWLSIRDLEVPSIAAINGPAIGAGLCLASRWPPTCGTSRAARSCPRRSSASGCTPGWPPPGCCRRRWDCPSPASCS
jgi:enoyl-CoA hydratase/carnithine racemase